MLTGLRGAMRIAMLYSKRMCLAAFLMAIFVPMVRAEDLPVGEVLKKTSEVYRNLTAYEFVVTRTYEVASRSQLAMGQSHIALSGVKPGKRRIAFKDSNQELVLVADGEVTWTFAPKLKSYTKQQAAMAADDEDDSAGVDVLTDAERSLMRSFETLEKYAPIAVLSKQERIKAGRDKVDCYVVRLALTQAVHELWIDTQRFIVLRHKQVSRGTGGEFPVLSTTTTNWQQASINAAPADDVFTFTPPPDAKEVATLNLPGERPVLTGKMAADFTLKDLQGNEIRLSALRGRIVLLDFWATWCPPCRKELPSIEKLARKYKESDVVIFGINDEDSGTVKSFLKKNDYNLTTLMDSKRTVHRMYGASAIPSVIVIDRNGMIKAHYVGSRSEEELVAALKTAGLEQ
jgi:peroxiredoxin/outer membrane lipoprotein-sorting protein